MGDIIVVTGGAGYVGSHLTRKLLARGFKVRVLDSFVYGDRGLSEVHDHPDLELITGDICNTRDLARALKGSRGVIALAAVVGDAACDLYPERSMAINYDSTQKTLAACQEAGVRRLVFASSCSVYGANGNDLLYEESHLNPVSLYARTRLMSEELLLRKAGGVEIAILRLATVCGVSPRMRFDLMVNTMTACAVVQRAIRVSGANQWRPHLHVQDAAEAFALAMESPAAKGGDLQRRIGRSELHGRRDRGKGRRSRRRYARRLRAQWRRPPQLSGQLRAHPHGSRFSGRAHGRRCDPGGGRAVGQRLDRGLQRRAVPQRQVAQCQRRRRQGAA